MGKGQPRRYFLCSQVVVDRVERINKGSFRNSVTGSSGRDFSVEIGELSWFPKLFKLTGNFGLGQLQCSIFMHFLNTRATS